MKRIGQLKDDSVHILNDAKYMENFMDDDNNMDENVEKVLFLSAELLKNNKMIEMTRELLK